MRGGGRLLLIADHAPFGVAAADLAARFGVGMGKGWTFEPADNANGLTSQLVYSRENGRLGDHAITRGRDADEAVAAVTAFTSLRTTIMDVRVKGEPVANENKK